MKDGRLTQATCADSPLLFDNNRSYAVNVTIGTNEFNEMFSDVAHQNHYQRPKLLEHNRISIRS